MVAFTRFPALDRGFGKKVEAVKAVIISYDNIGLFCLSVKIYRSINDVNILFSYICDSRAQDKENDETVRLFF